MDPLLNRLQDFEARYERLLLTVQQLSRQVANLANQIQQTQGQSGGGGSGGGGTIYWASNASAIGPATIAGGVLPADITPVTFTSNIYYDLGGTMTLQATSATVLWWYLDTAPANSLIAVAPAGANWDAIAAGCTAL